MRLILIYKIPSMKIEISIHDYSHDLFLFLFFISTKSKNKKGHPLLSIKKPFSEVALQTRESLKRPYFPLPLSILPGTNVILLFIFIFLQPRLIPKKIHPPFVFRESSSSFDFRENPCKTPKENQKDCLFFFLLPVFSGSVLGVALLLYRRPPKPEISAKFRRKKWKLSSLSQCGQQ